LRRKLSGITDRIRATRPRRVRDEIVGRCARAWSRWWSGCEQHLEEPGQVEPADLADLEALRARLYQDRALGATSAGRAERRAAQVREAGVRLRR